MQKEPIEATQKYPGPTSSPATPIPSDNGSVLQNGGSADAHGQSHELFASRVGSASGEPSTAGELRPTESAQRGLSHDEPYAYSRPGQKIINYEQALARNSSMPIQASGFKVTRGQSSDAGGLQLLDLPMGK